MERNFCVFKFSNTGLALTYDPQERSIEASINDVPLFRLLPSDTPDFGFIVDIEYSLCQSGLPPKFMPVSTWSDMGRFEKLLKLFYSAIIEDFTNLHDSLTLAASKDSTPGDYIAIEINTKDLRKQTPESGRRKK